MICKYSKCEKELTNPKANTCSDAHRKAWKRENPDVLHGQINPDNADLPTRTSDNPDNCPQSGQPSSVQPLNKPAKRSMPLNQRVDKTSDPWAYNDDEYEDADVIMSKPCRDTKGMIQLPGDRGYQGACKQDDKGNWHGPTDAKELGLS